MRAYSVVPKMIDDYYHLWRSVRVGSRGSAAQAPDLLSANRIGSVLIADQKIWQSPRRGKTIEPTATPYRPGDGGSANCICSFQLW